MRLTNRARQTLAVMRRRVASTGEEGRIMLLVLGFAVLAISIGLVVASVTAVHIQRKQLLNIADLAALAASAQIDEAAMLASGGTVVIDEAAALQTIEDVVAQSPAGDLTNIQIVEPTGSSDGQSIDVTLRAVATVPFVPWLADAIPSVLTIEVTSSAQADLRP